MQLRKFLILAAISGSLCSCGAPIVQRTLGLPATVIQKTLSPIINPIVKPLLNG